MGVSVDSLEDSLVPDCGDYGIATGCTILSQCLSTLRLFPMIGSLIFPVGEMLLHTNTLPSVEQCSSHQSILVSSPYFDYNTVPLAESGLIAEHNAPPDVLDSLVAGCQHLEVSKEELIAPAACRFTHISHIFLYSC